MCEYAVPDRNNPMLFKCVPLNKPCTLCFMGNMNQYNEAKMVSESMHYRCKKEQASERSDCET